MAEGYVINVGQHAPQKVIIATPDKDRKPVEDTIIEAYKSNGAHLPMNRARVWARRVMTDGKLPKNSSGSEDVLEVTDVRYKGDLEFLKWGDNKLGAQAIEVRWLPTSRSLDFDYQKTVQKLETRPEEGLDSIPLKSGENRFDLKTEALKIQMLKVHPQNRDSVSKNPDPMIKGYMFYEVTDEQVDKAFTKNKEASITTGNFVIGLSTKERSLRNLFEIFVNYGVDFGDINYLSNGTDIYNALLKFSENPGEFGSQVNRYKKELYDNFDKAKSYKALDLTKDGFIAFRYENKTDIVWEKAEGKGDKMIEWVIDNFTDDYVYKQSQYFKALCEKLK